jgi:hypothetical protein
VSAVAVKPVLDAPGCIRVARAQVRLAVLGLGLGDFLTQLYVDEIPVELSTRGKPGRAGRAGFFQAEIGPNGIGRIVINTGVCYTDERFMSTLYHEMAHAVNYWINGPYRDSHGPQWQAIMERLGQPIERCHNYPDRK